MSMRREIGSINVIKCPYLYIYNSFTERRYELYAFDYIQFLPKIRNGNILWKMPAIAYCDIILNGVLYHDFYQLLDSQKLLRQLIFILYKLI